MNPHDATEVAYKNGYEKGKADAAKDILALIAGAFAGMEAAAQDAIDAARLESDYSYARTLETTRGAIQRARRILTSILEIKYKPKEAEE